MPDELQDKSTQNQLATPVNGLPEYEAWEKTRAAAPTDGDDAAPSDATPVAVSAPDADTGKDHPSEAVAPPEPPPPTDERRKPKAVDDLIRYRRRAHSSERISTELAVKVEALEARLAQLTAPTANGTPTETKPEKEKATPRLEEFATVDEWGKALLAREVSEVLEKQAQLNREAQAREQEQRRLAHWSAASAQAEEKYPGFNAAVDNALRRGHVLPVLGDAIVELSADEPEKAAAIAYALTQNPQEARRLSALTPYKVAVELGKLIPTLSPGTNGKNHSEASKPVPAASATTVLNGSAPTTPSIGDANQSYSQYERIRNKEEAARRR